MSSNLPSLHLMSNSPIGIREMSKMTPSVVNNCARGAPSSVASAQPKKPYQYWQLINAVAFNSSLIKIVESSYNAST